MIPALTTPQHDGGQHVTTMTAPRTEAAPGRPPEPELSALVEAPAAGTDDIGTETSPETEPGARRRLTQIMVAVAVVAVVAGLAVAAVGFALSYRALVDAAIRWGFGPTGSYVFPIGVDGLIVALYSIALVLAWRRMPKPMLLVAAHATTGVTVVLNVLAAADSAPGSQGVWEVAQTDPGRLLAHAAMPIAYVLLTEAARHLITRTARLESGERGLALADWVLRFPTTWAVFRLAKTTPMPYAEARRVRRELAIHGVWIEYREQIEVARLKAAKDGEEFSEYDTVTVLDRLPELLAPYGVTPDEALALPDQMRASEQKRRSDRERAQRALARQEAADRRELAHADKMAQLAAEREELRAIGERDVLRAEVDGERKAAEHQASAAADTAGIQASAARTAAERAATEAQRRAVAEEEAEESAREAAARRKAAEDTRDALTVEQQNVRRRQEIAEGAQRAADAKAHAQRAARAAAEDDAAATAAQRQAAENREAASRAELITIAAEDAAGLSLRDRTIRRVARLIVTEADGEALRLPLARIEQMFRVANGTASGYRDEASQLIRAGYDYRTDPLHQTGHRS